MKSIGLILSPPILKHCPKVFPSAVTSNEDHDGISE